MRVRRSSIFLAAGLAMVCAFAFLAGTLSLWARGVLPGPIHSTPDFAGTLQALVASSGIPTATAPATSVPAADQPTGHIVLTCQIFKFQSSEQICIMSADGTGYRRLTADDNIRHFYPSPAPDGRSIVYSQYREDNVYEIYELVLANGVATRLTDRLGVLTAPEISPDGTRIVFVHWTAASDQYEIWIMKRDGTDPHRLLNGTGWDPTWSPDGNQILFASDRDGTNQLYAVHLDGSGLRRISDLPALRGRSDWSSLDQIVTYSGDAWSREVYLMNSDGSDPHQVSPSGGNSQGPSFSPDGRWIAFTAYYDRMNDINGCEIYVIRTDGSGLRRLTDNDYCHYQPRWGP